MAQFLHKESHRHAALWIKTRVIHVGSQSQALKILHTGLPCPMSYIKSLYDTPTSCEIKSHP
ncbi:hypothetical protein SHDE107825_10385 [Shewanella denitrificans]